MFFKKAEITIRTVYGMSGNIVVSVFGITVTIKVVGTVAACDIASVITAVDSFDIEIVVFVC